MSQTILITGASSGIGRVTARLFLDQGWKVALVGRRKSALEETAEGHEDSALILPTDVTSEDAVTQSFVKVAEEWGRLDVLFNNAGMNVKGGTLDEISVEDFRALSETNITGMFICARAAFGLMRRQDPMGGRIINNGSISAHVPRPGSAPYTMSKHAVTGLTRTVSLDGRPFNIACGQIDIGNALTDMAEAMTKGVPQADGSNKVEAVMDASNVASSVLHMASLPAEANVQFMTVMATTMPYIGRG
ncbi:NADP-dependent 3-hydroxy acid dehydrogenase YdfG [Palleronia salina]|uniref:NADP-dependent 3-hydroxy acid dehydrogenase YdfG n=2 Tax=Palleronia TaxID=315422 RepID=A0A1M6DPQ9_9RHOB|nr:MULTISPECIES: SDR family oxidoreductase [Palleronia]SEN35130.1 NADP-dependent 3-hydroxy acid dehydrogenase YdfG [Palleronia pelagia]SHI75119.1 NADP-dependent 3-hydroxy acid dehydrogenase YdfG [Palleronia salina]